MSRDGAESRTGHCTTFIVLVSFTVLCVMFGTVIVEARPQLAVTMESTPYAPLSTL